jgi:hypothetical protein
VTPVLGGLLSRSVLAALACFAFAAADAFGFHRFSPEVELTVFYAGLGALGVGGAFTAGVQVPTPKA